MRVAVHHAEHRPTSGICSRLHVEHLVAVQNVELPRLVFGRRVGHRVEVVHVEPTGRTGEQAARLLRRLGQGTVQHCPVDVDGQRHGLSHPEKANGRPGSVGPAPGARLHRRTYLSPIPGPTGRPVRFRW